MATRGRVLRGKRWGQQINELLRQPPADIHVWMYRHSAVLKSDARGLVGLMQIRQLPCLLKFYHYQSRLRRALLVLGIGRPLRSYRISRTLAGLGVPVPCPFSCLLLPEGALLLTEGFDGALNLREMWQQDAPPAIRAEMLRRAGETLAYLHKSGYVHGDCKWHNILWHGDQFYLVDLDAAARPRFFKARRRARDLARFTVNAEELGVEKECYQAFLEGYLAIVREPREELVKQIMRYLKIFRARHLARYGIRGHALL